MTNVILNNKVNPDLDKERQICSFNVEEFSSWWLGGDKKLQEKRKRGNKN